METRPNEVLERTIVYTYDATGRLAKKEETGPQFWTGQISITEETTYEYEYAIP